MSNSDNILTATEQETAPDALKGVDTTTQNMLTMDQIFPGNSKAAEVGQPGILA